MRSMLLPAGGTFPLNQVDPESIRFDGTSLYWTSEGNRAVGNLQNPFVRKMDLSGAHLSELSTPARLLRDTRMESKYFDWSFMRPSMISCSAPHKASGGDCTSTRLLRACFDEREFAK